MSADYDTFRLFTRVSIKTKCSSKETRALIDTGSVITCISKKFIESNNIFLERTNEEVTIKTINSWQTHYKYKSTLIIDDVEIQRKVVVIPNLEHDVIIGMDIILFSDFYIHYNGGNDVDFRFTLNSDLL